MHGFSSIYICNMIRRKNLLNDIASYVDIAELPYLESIIVYSFDTFY